MENVRIAIIGLGYVGLPLAIEFSRRYRVVGFDINSQRVREVASGYDANNEMNKDIIRNCIEKYGCGELGFFPTNDYTHLNNIDVFIITVPTPVDDNKNPDLSILFKATELVGEFLRAGNVVIYESTVYPGCTEDECVPILENVSGLKFNLDFFVGYSPERINPGDKGRLLTNIRKVTSGSTPASAEFVDMLYGSVINGGTYKATSIRVAEATKAIENAQRDINISFMNEVALILDSMNIDTYDVLEAASTKWNFLDFKPGLVGGHCIGVDPYYLAFQAKRKGVMPNIISSGRTVNEGMGKFIADKVKKLLEKKGFNPFMCKILILGFTFKENCSDIRNTGVAVLYNNIKKYAFAVDIFDPVANKEEVEDKYGISLRHSFEGDYDMIIHAVNHNIFKEIKWAALRENGTLIFDIKGVLDKTLISGRL